MTTPVISPCRRQKDELLPTMLPPVNVGVPAVIPQRMLIFEIVLPSALKYRCVLIVLMRHFRNLSLAMESGDAYKDLLTDWRLAFNGQNPLPIKPLE